MEYFSSILAFPFYSIYFAFSASVLISLPFLFLSKNNSNKLNYKIALPTFVIAFLFFQVSPIPQKNHDALVTLYQSLDHNNAKIKTMHIEIKRQCEINSLTLAYQAHMISKAFSYDLDTFLQSHPTGFTFVNKHPNKQKICDLVKNSKT